MSSLVHTTSESLCKLVRWAHSHGTICNLIPSLQHLTCGSYDTAQPPEPGPNGSGVSVGVWSCDAGHAYNWPLADHSSSCRGPATVGQGQERFVGGRLSHKGTVRASCDLSCSDAASEAEELSGRLFDIAGCESSATDEDGDYEPRPSRKRGRSAGGAVGGKKVKQETTSAEDFDSAEHASSAATDSVSHTRNTQPQIAQTALLPKLTPNPRAQQGLDLGSEGLVDPVKEMLGGESCATETSEKTAGWQGELEKLQALLNTERSRNQQMAETISSLKQDKELLQSEITKKAELICDFLQDKLRPEKTLHRFSNPVEPGSSHLTSADDGGGFDSPTMFDSFEEMDLHPLEQRTLKSKRSRDGENPRVRMKNVVGVIARYMAALKEFHRSVSMKVAFDRVGVDRNTISRTAAIAELSLAAPEVFHGLVPWNEKEETLAHYAHRCRQAMDDNIKAKIQTMKAKGELLPIVSK